MNYLKLIYKSFLSTPELLIWWIPMFIMDSFLIIKFGPIIILNFIFLAFCSQPMIDYIKTKNKWQLEYLIALIAIFCHLGLSLYVIHL